MTTPESTVSKGSASLAETLKRAGGTPATFKDVLAWECRALPRQGGAGTAPPAAAPEVNADEAIAAAHARQFAGLAFSGGGIRSATFNLGVLQALSRLKLLGRFDYLSTVSGGGYIGSWLSAWIRREADAQRNAGETPDPVREEQFARHGLESVEAALARSVAAAGTARQYGHEPGEIRFLRSYSNYLTPRTGLLSADTLASVSTYVRNLVLNQTILLLILAFVLVLPRVVVAGFGALSEMGQDFLAFGLLLLVASVLVIAWNLACATERLPGTPPPRWSRQGHVLLTALMPGVISAAAFGAWLLEDAGVVGAGHWLYRWAEPLLGVFGSWHDPLTWAAGGALAYSIAWLLGWLLGFVCTRTRGSAPADSGGAATGVGEMLRRGYAWYVLGPVLAGALGGYVCWLLRGFVLDLGEPLSQWHVIGFGAPVMVLVFSLVVTLHIGLAKRLFSEQQIEWWSRLGGWSLLAAGAWAGQFALIVYGPPSAIWAGHWLAALGGGWIVSTVAGVLFGKGAASGGAASSGWKETLFGVAPYVFIAGLVVAVAVGLHYLFEAVYDLRWIGLPPGTGGSGLEPGLVDADAVLFADLVARELALLDAVSGAAAVIWCAGLFGLALLLSARVDVNLFSIHHYYRNRLVRCYLGASRAPVRAPSAFTGFDAKDDLRVADLLGAAADPVVQRPYHIVNTAINLTHADDLAWQERKAASFVVTPAYSGYELTRPEGTGSTEGGYRPTAEYGGRLHLGSAMAVSGAAASPNWGYHTSPAMAFLLTVFNVRLGRWCGNTAVGNKWRRESPIVGMFYLLRELFGSTDASSNYVYLSDGGHFENLGIYELVRRRCRYIVVSDGGQDGQCTFEDLGNAIRKCYIDLGIVIDIDTSALVPLGDPKRSRHSCAVGRIRYDRVDRGAAPGIIVYLKPTLTGDEAPDIAHYHSLNPDFPHQTTGDQFFDESQFESYRKLGYHIAMRVFAADAASTGRGEPVALDDLFQALRERWYPPNPRVGAAFAEHGRNLEQLLVRIASERDLEFLDRQIYPEWDRLMEGATGPRPAALWLPSREAERRAGFYACNMMLQLMENVYIDLALDQHHAHPDNRGWMNLFRHWAWSGMLRVTFAICGSTYGARFQTFCRQHLGLTLGNVVVESRSWTGGPPDDALLDAAAPELNAYERRLIRAYAAGTRRATGGGAERRVANRFDRVLVCKVRLPDPLTDAGPFEFPFGFALADGDRVAYFRVQDHLRGLGLARRAIDAMYTDCGIRAIEEGIDADVLAAPRRADSLVTEAPRVEQPSSVDIERALALGRAAAGRRGMPPGGGTR